MAQKSKTTRNVKRNPNRRSVVLTDGAKAALESVEASGLDVNRVVSNAIEKYLGDPSVQEALAALL